MLKRSADAPDVSQPKMPRSSEPEPLSFPPLPLLPPTSPAAPVAPIASMTGKYKFVSVHGKVKNYYFEKDMLKDGVEHILKAFIDPPEPMAPWVPGPPVETDTDDEADGPFDVTAEVPIATVTWNKGRFQAMHSVLHEAIFHHIRSPHTDFFMSFKPYYATIDLFCLGDDRVTHAVLSQSKCGLPNVCIMPQRSGAAVAAGAAGADPGWMMWYVSGEARSMEARFDTSLKNGKVTVARCDAIESIMLPVPNMDLFKGVSFGGSVWNATVEGGQISRLTSESVTVTWDSIGALSRPSATVVDLFFAMQPAHLAKHDPVIVGKLGQLKCNIAALDLTSLPGLKKIEGLDDDPLMACFMPDAPLTATWAEEMSDLTLVIDKWFFESDGGMVPTFVLMSDHGALSCATYASHTKYKRFASFKVNSRGDGGFKIIGAMPSDELSSSGNQKFAPVVGHLVLKNGAIVNTAWAVGNIKSAYKLTIQFEERSTYVMCGTFKDRNLPAPGSSSQYFAIRHEPNDVILWPFSHKSSYRAPQWIVSAKNCFEGFLKQVVDLGDKGVQHVTMAAGVIMTFGGIFVDNASENYPVHMQAMQFSNGRPLCIGPLSYQYIYPNFMLVQGTYDVMERLHQRAWDIVDWSRATPRYVSGIFVDRLMAPRPGTDLVSPYMSKADLCATFKYGFKGASVFADYLSDSLAFLPVRLDSPPATADPVQLCGGLAHESDKLVAALTKCAIEVTVRPCVWRQLHFGLWDPFMMDSVIPRECPPEGSLVVVHTYDSAIKVLDTISGLSACRCPAASSVPAGAPSRPIIDLSIDAPPCTCNVEAELSADDVKPAAKMTAMSMDIFHDYAHKCGRQPMAMKKPLVGIMSLMLKVSTEPGAL